MATDEPPERAVIKTWESALASFRKSIPKKDFEQIQQSTSPQDLLSYIDSVQQKEDGINDAKILLAIKACAHRLQRFSGALDMLAQGGAGPGCLVWGSIKFALMIVSGSFEESERLLKALVLIGDCLPRVEIYNETFLNSSTVQAHVHGIYVTILDFWARAIKFYKRRKLWKFVRSSWHDYDVEFGNLEKTLHRHQDGLEKAAMAQHMSDYHADSAEYKKSFKAIATVNTALAHKEIVQWLAPIEYEADYYMEDLEYARKLRHPGTCEWIRTQPDFRIWWESAAPSRESLLWIHAIPGAGKTVLSSFLIDHAARFDFRLSSAVIYFLFKSTDSDKNSITAAARSLLYQLYKIRGSTDAAFVDEIKKHLDNSGQSRAKSFKTIWTLFCGYVAKLTGLVIVIDALDECIEPRFFIKGLQQLSKCSAVKIVVTSRREKELVEDLCDWMAIEMSSKEVAADIAAFLEYKVCKSPKLSHPLVRSSVLKLLQSRSNGMFLWVALMIKDLKSKASIYEINDALLTLPEGLDRMYERILSRLHNSLKPSPKKLCLRVLRWVVCATRPLRLKELEEALKLEYTGETPLFGHDNALIYTERDIELACGSLLTVRSSTVQLVHLSAREFLQDPSIRLNIDDALHQYLVDVPSVNRQITSHCVSYLMSRCSAQEVLPADDNRSPTYNADQLKQTLPLLDYVCFNWLRHFISSIETPIEEYVDKIQPFFKSQYCLIWISLCFSLDPDCSLRLRADIQELLDWTSSYFDGSEPSLSTSSVLIQLAIEWAGNFQNFITEYGDILKDSPFEVHFIDPERIFGSKSSSHFFISMPKVSFERHILLPDPAIHSEHTPISPKFQLQKNTGLNDELGYFYLDPRRDVFYVIDLVTFANPRIFVQERSTGRRLAPLTDLEMDYGYVPYQVNGACISADGHHLAVSFRIGPTEERVGFDYTAVWAIAKDLDFAVGNRAFAWGKKLFSLTADSKFNESIGSFRWMVFASDGSLCCPTGRISFSTGEVQPLSPELSLVKDGDRLSYSEDGRSLVWIHEAQIELFTLEGKRLRSFALHERSICHYIHECNYVVYSLVLKSHHSRLFVKDLQTGLTKALDTPMIISSFIGSKFRHYGGDKLLGVVSARDGKSRKTSLIVWTGVPFNPHLWAVKDLANEIVGHFLDERSLLLYAVFPGRIWGRIGLESSALTEKDLHITDQTHSNSIRVEHCISKNGRKLAEVKFQKLRASIRVLDLNRPGENLLSSSLALPSFDIFRAAILFSPNIGLLLVNNLLYHLDCNDQVGKLASEVIPNLPSEDQNKDEQPVCIFSSCENYLVIASSPSPTDDRKPMTLDVYNVSFPNGGISKLDVSLEQLKIFAGVEIAGIKIDFHPDQPKLGVVYWMEPDESFQIRCLVLDLRTMSLKHLQPSLREEICVTTIFDDHSAKFSGCGHYFIFDQRYVFSLSSNRPEPNSLCKKPLIIQPGKQHLYTCFFDAMLITSSQTMYLSTSGGVENEIKKKNETKVLTTFPAHLREADFVLLTGEEEDSNLRVVFWKGHDPPEIKYLNITWKDLLSRYSNDFSTKFHALRESTG